MEPRKCPTNTYTSVRGRIEDGRLAETHRHTKAETHTHTLPFQTPPSPLQLPPLNSLETCAVRDVRRASLARALSRERLVALCGVGSVARALALTSGYFVRGPGYVLYIVYTAYYPDSTELAYCLVCCWLVPIATCNK